MKSILGIGNALTDILAVLPDDSFLKEFHLPKGSMQHVDQETGEKIFNSLQNSGLRYRGFVVGTDLTGPMVYLYHHPILAGRLYGHGILGTGYLYFRARFMEIYCRCRSDL